MSYCPSIVMKQEEIDAIPEMDIVDVFKSEPWKEGVRFKFSTGETGIVIDGREHVIVTPEHVARFEALPRCPRCRSLAVKIDSKERPLACGDCGWTKSCPSRRVEKRPGRNDPCPCGSGKKYKKCCL